MIHRYAATVGKRTIEVAVEAIEAGRWRVTLDGKERIWDARPVGTGQARSWSLLPGEGGASRVVDLDTLGGDLVASVGDRAWAIKLADARRALVEKAGVASARAETGPAAVRAPMPGKVVKVLVKAGDAVKAGQGVVVVEAMKMENELRAPRDGTIAEVKAQEGQAVEAGAVLVTVG